MVVSLLRNIFKRTPARCEVCGKPHDRVHRLDETWRDEYKGGRKRQVCTTCLRDELKAAFSTVRVGCVLAQPVVKSNAYYAYTDTDKDLRTALGGEAPRDEIEVTRQAIRRLADQIQGRNCDHCEHTSAEFLWLPGEAFDYKWWSFSVNEIAQSRQVFPALCASCAATAVAYAVETIGLRLDEVWAPRDGTVLMFSGEA